MKQRIRIYGQDKHTRKYLKRLHVGYYYDSKIKNTVIRLLMRELGIKHQPFILIVNDKEQITDYWSGFQPKKLNAYSAKE